MSIRSATIKRLTTGVPGLDEILGGGLPELSFNLISGPPGSGKTTLAHQIMFSLATRDRPALFFSVLGEPPLKILRYQQQFSFFDFDKVDGAIRYVNLNDELTSGNLHKVLARIIAEVHAVSPATLIIDSFRSVIRQVRHQTKASITLQEFIQQLGLQLSGWEVTSFLVGDFDSNGNGDPIMTVADGILSLCQSIHRNSVVRKLQVSKMRGQAINPGMHTFRISGAGIEIFPAAPIRDDPNTNEGDGGSPRGQQRIAMGVPGLDEMLGGGLPSGYSLLVAGPSGSGKTILATAFLAEGVRRGESGVIVAFEQTPSQSKNRTIDDLVRAGKIGLINTRQLDLSIDEVVQLMMRLIRRMNANRVVIDSLSGFELAVAPTFREDFRESMFRMIAVLAGLGVTVLLTSELEDRYTDLRFSPYGSAFLTDAIIVQRYVEIDSRMKRVMAVAKVRSSAHSNEIREYEVNDDGIAIGRPLLGYDGLFAGRPQHSAATGEKG